MDTAHFGNHTCFSFSYHHQMSLWMGGLSFNRSRVIITRWSPGLMSRGRGVCPQVWCLGRGVLFHVNYPMMHLMFPTPRSPGLMSGERGTLPCELSHDAFDVSYPPVNRQMPVKALPSHNFCNWPQQSECKFPVFSYWGLWISIGFLKTNSCLSFFT